MATIVSTASFINEIFVPGLENVHEAVCQELTALVLKYEPEYLKSVLGLSFYNAVLAAIGDGSSVSQQFKDLVDGATYTVNERQYEWKGLRDYTARFIYYWYARNNFSATTIAGQVQPNVENATVVTAAHKMVKVYNDSMEGAHCCWHFLDNNKAIYPEYNSAYTDRCYFVKINAVGV